MIQTLVNSESIKNDYVHRMRTAWPGWLNRSHRKWLFKFMMLEWITSVDPWYFWTGKRLP